jgi:DhnA family fructose-bisphosphate aldolase class Ia
MNTGQSIRIREFMDETGKSLVLDFTRGFLGGEFTNIKEPLSGIDGLAVDAVILSPGEAKQHADILCKKRVPVIIKCDWSNRLLGEQSAYPAQKFRQVPACDAAEALRLGASAAIADVVLGTPDDDTVKGLRWLRTLAQDGNDGGLPVIANIIPLGSRVTPDNFADVAGLGMRTCLELGATAAAVPVVDGEAARKLVAASMNCPLFAFAASPAGIKVADDLRAAFKAMSDAGIRALVVDGFDPPAGIGKGL